MADTKLVQQLEELTDIAELDSLPIGTGATDLRRLPIGTLRQWLLADVPTPRDGEDGSGWRSGTGAPPVELGRDGDYYFDRVAQTIYGPKVEGIWSAGTSIAGGDGRSAYQAWLDQGNAGSEEDFLAALVGKPFATGVATEIPLLDVPVGTDRIISTGYDSVGAAPAPMFATICAPTRCWPPTRAPCSAPRMAAYSASTGKTG
ncbi:hypothetical protein [Croceicoccus sp. YJ47]|uniref:hypothetical protein n=1 Tax=Croceicoccus sp. YJ47 TaxID=2798724 RepID=UPI0019223EB3|nr:hypothetical protein [Croceicoccus sp. YJ47]QQN73164.1 hypothetical protein JD971_09815 [Croceicoccus sp. YJ47]